MVNKLEKPSDMFEGAEAVIFAPHPDDEIIGCYEVLIEKNPVVIYSSEVEPARREKALKLKEHVNIKAQLFLMTVPPGLLIETTKFYFPDPTYEIHPNHRVVGFMGEQLARNGFDVTFYNTLMNAPYIHECKNSDGKLALLNTVYPDQKSLWEYDHKYFLFEGYTKWIF